MNSNEEQVRAAIAEQAGEWFLANEEGSLDAADAAALAAWLRASPVHIEEFLGVSVVARDLKEARSDPEYSIEAILARARAEHDPPVRTPWSRFTDAIRRQSSSHWLPAGVTMAACAVVSLGSFMAWNMRNPAHLPAPSGLTALHFETRHGEQLTHRLPDNSVVHLNTDSAVDIRYGKTERLITLTNGQAEFDVVHESARAFRVIAGSAEVIDLGTKFDVHLERASTVVTVVEGQVSVGRSPATGGITVPSSESPASRFVEVGAGQQISVTQGEGPATPVAVDAQSATAWLRREIVFDHEPLEQVVAEYNRYTAKPIEIATPTLRSLQISGVFATDDTEAFVAFLRSLKGVRVEVTERQIRVSRD